jgi:riboflavin transporter FmnP
MNTRLIAIVAVFAALAIVLNPVISGMSVPAPYFPLLSYGFWELPQVIVLLLTGLIPGVAVGLVASIALAPLHPNYIAIVGGTLAWLSMLTGVYLGYRFVTHNVPQGQKPSARKTVLFLTVGGIILRTVVMSIQNYVMLRYPLPIGLGLPESIIIGIMPPVALFNATQPLLVIPLGYLIAKKLGKHLKLGNKI